jgi:hypothetical protein
LAIVGSVDAALAAKKATATIPIIFDHADTRCSACRARRTVSQMVSLLLERAVVGSGLENVATGVAIKLLGTPILLYLLS